MNHRTIKVGCSNSLTTNKIATKSLRISTLKRYTIKLPHGKQSTFTIEKNIAESQRRRTSSTLFAITINMAERKEGIEFGLTDRSLRLVTDFCPVELTAYYWLL